MDESLKPDFFNDLLIVLVIHKMKVHESPSYQSLTTALPPQKNSATLFIYDNSPQPQELKIDPGWNAIYRHDSFNAGVSKAYNDGFKMAKQLNKKWLLLADQDTVFPGNSFQNYFKSAVENVYEVVVPILTDRVGIVSPFRFRFGGGARVKNIKGLVSLSLKDYCVINSGLLISVNLFEKAGGYDENLSLDFSDIAFVHRLKEINDSFAVADIVCQHELSALGKISAEDQLIRFANYVRASRYFKRNYSASMLLECRMFLRASRFSILYLNFNFMLLFFKQV